MNPDSITEEDILTDKVFPVPVDSYSNQKDSYTTT
jgi:hypothetical protein